MDKVYPRQIVLQNDKLKRLLQEKADMITEGRQVSEEIEVKEIELEAIDKEMVDLESRVDTEDLKKEAEELTKEFNAVMSKMEDNQKRLRERLIEKTPKELREKYDNIKSEKRDLELKRNKIALKATKWNDKIIPMGRKLMKPFIEDDYEDYDSIRLENGEIVCTLFSHLDDFLRNFAKKKK